MQIFDYNKMLLKYFKILYIVLFQEFLINFVKAQNFKEVCSAGVDTCTESCKSFFEVHPWTSYVHGIGGWTPWPINSLASLRNCNGRGPCVRGPYKKSVELIFGTDGLDNKSGYNDCVNQCTDICETDNNCQTCCKSACEEGLKSFNKDNNSRITIKPNYCETFCTEEWNGCENYFNENDCEKEEEENEEENEEEEEEEENEEEEEEEEENEEEEEENEGEEENEEEEEQENEEEEEEEEDKEEEEEKE
jgi:hypothetical protein